MHLLDHDAEQYVMLLERLDSTRSLGGEPIGEAVTVAGGLLRRPAVTAPPLHRSLTGIAERWQQQMPADADRLGNIVPARLVDEAVAHCRELSSDIGSLMVNEDLHYENVLRGNREPWLVIDPKVVSGDPEYGVIPLLRNRFDEMNTPRRLCLRLDTVIDVAELDRARAYAWTFTRAVDDWLYFLDRDDPTGIRTAAVIAGCSTSRRSAM